MTTRDRVKAMTLMGMSVREISRALDVSTQAVYQHLEKLHLKPARRKR